MLRIDCWGAEKDLKTTYGSECALTSLAVDEPLEYARLYLDGNLQMWIDSEDSRITGRKLLMPILQGVRVFYVCWRYFSAGVLFSG